MVFIYDGTFEGFLSAVFDAYVQKTEPRDIVPSTSDFQMSFNAEYHYVETTAEKADRLMAGMEKIGGGFSGQTIFAFLSWVPGKEMTIYRYIILGFQIKEKIFSKLDDNTVRQFQDLCSQTGREKNKWKGFLRFSVMQNNVYCAEMSPKNNVLMLIMPHFTRRMPTTPFLIHDKTYGQIGMYNTKEWYIRSSEGFALPGLRSDEKSVRAMWKLFYDTTAVESRANGRQRRQIMPLRYQKHVTELHEQAFPIHSGMSLISTDSFEKPPVSSKTVSGWLTVCPEPLRHGKVTETRTCPSS
jgi:probable DNA metabolism protein